MTTKMLNMKQEHERQTKIRHALIEQGYRPLPTAEKSAFQKKWPHQVVDHAAVDGWSMSTSRLTADGEGKRTVPTVTTAIQLQGTMLAIDVDVQNEEVSQLVDDAIYMALGGDTYDKAPLRRTRFGDSGKRPGSKFMMLVRTETPFAMWKTAKYVDPDRDDHMVEMYGGAATRYFSCYGPHTLGVVEDGLFPIEKEYVWAEGPTPLDTRPEDLPLIEGERLKALQLEISDILALQVHDRGWERVAVERASDGGKDVRYDLTDDMVFSTAAGDLTYLEAMAFALTTPDARCSGSFIDGSSSNRTRCRMGVVGNMDDGSLALQVFDHDTWILHMHESAAPVTQEERREATLDLGSKLRNVLSEETMDTLERIRDETDADQERIEEAIDKAEELIETLALNTVTGMAHWLKPGLIGTGITIKTLDQHMAPFSVNARVMGDGGRMKSVTVSPSGIWKTSPSRIDIHGVRMNPKLDDRVYEAPGGLVYANRWFGLRDLGEAQPGAVALVERFLEHLLPDEEEREFYLDWLADKVQRPWHRNCAVVMMSPNIYGAGRGTLFEWVDRIFAGYAFKAGKIDIAGRWTDWMEHSLMVTIEEVGGWASSERAKVYEALKTMVDPGVSSLRVEGKGEAIFTGTTYASWQLATNKVNGLPLARGDRRFAVLTNGEAMSMDLVREVHGLGEAPPTWSKDEMAAALTALVSQRVVTRNLITPPTFVGHEEMVEEGDETLEATKVLMEIISEAPAWRCWRRKDLADQMGASMGTTRGVEAALRELKGSVAKEFGAWVIPRKMKVGSGASGQMVRLIAKDPRLAERWNPEERASACIGRYPGEGAGDNVVPLR